MSDRIVEAVDRLKGFYRNRLGIQGRVALHEPLFEGNEWAYVKDCLDTGWVSSAGTYVERIEAMTAEICGTEHAVAVVNGTLALHATLTALKIGAGDAVICPALTFVATANAISYCQASPLFVDISPRTYGIDVDKLRDLFARDCERRLDGLFHKQSGLKIAAIIPVHIFGHPVDMAPLMALGEEYGLMVVEDSAEALGSLYRGKPCGGLAHAGVVSFNGNKIVTTGGGGVIVTNDEHLAKALKHLTTTARVPDRWWFDHDEVGYNYRMPNINAALGCAQLEKLSKYIARKRTLANLYADLFADMDDIDVVREPDGCAGNYWLNAILFEGSVQRDEFLELTNAQDIQTRPCWRLMSELEIYKDAPRADDLSVAENIVSRLVNIPSGPQLIVMNQA